MRKTGDEWLMQIWRDRFADHGLGPSPPATHSPGPYSKGKLGDALAKGKGKNGDALAKGKGGKCGKNKDAGKGHDDVLELI